MDKKLTYILLIGILILGFIFYWYEWRPSKIRQQCYADAVLNLNIMSITSDEQNVLKREELQNKLINERYNNCLKEKGLKN